MAGDRAVTDLEGSFGVIEIASRFDWKWSIEDVERFCRAAGWTVDHIRRRGALLETGLSAGDGLAHVSLDDQINTISFSASDEVDAADQRMVADLLGSFDAITRLVSEDLGEPSKREFGTDPRVRWDLQQLVIFVSMHSGRIWIRFVNPEFQKQQEIWDRDVAGTAEEY
ncbi:DUF6301 family protein [Nocardia goodfellowii]|uniref:Uncharacterized protein n=1 Tax=Nocardia goodfellowii TaxID=882446 RepID=A0ABS4QRH2_9NOCA|nr:DUF6301 family protein [Nocardia goodfellowii]MBP2194311.1 hypothetical protein [Nocardia goodfellowii]